MRRSCMVGRLANALLSLECPEVVQNYFSMKLPVDRMGRASGRLQLRVHGLVASSMAVGRHLAHLPWRAQGTGQCFGIWSFNLAIN
jgi:hypothetical protein